ncbi:MAG: MFS transporter [Chloroflexota bacterium]|nr:MFS transporter [Chloroflexota bacterium]
MTPPLSTRRRSRSNHPLANPSFLALWAVQAVTQTVQNVINFSLLVLAQTVTGSSAQVAFIILSFSFPAVIFSTLAGVLVDRWDKRRVMAWSNAIRGAAVLSYIFVNKPSEMAWVYTASFIFATSALFFSPAMGTLIPKIVGKDQLIAANSIFNVTFMASQFLGFTIIGWLMIRTLGLRNVFIVVFTIYLIASVVIALLPLPTMKAVAQKAGNPLDRMWTELLEGWRYIAARRQMVVTILHLSIANAIFLVIGAIGPAFVSEIIKRRAEDLGLLLAPAGICALLGALAVQHFARPNNRHGMVHFGLIGVGASIIGLAVIAPAVRLLGRFTAIDLSLSQLTALAVVLGMGFGFSAAFVAIPAQTVLQESSTDEIRGRVLATFFTVSNAASFLPIVLAGAVADRLGILETFGLVGAFILAVGALSQYNYTRYPEAWRIRTPGSID